MYQFFFGTHPHMDIQSTQGWVVGVYSWGNPFRNSNTPQIHRSSSTTQVNLHSATRNGYDSYESKPWYPEYPQIAGL